MDKGYQRLQNEIKVLLSKKKKPNQNLSFIEKSHNKRLVRARNHQEQTFGFIKNMFEITSTKYKGDLRLYKIFFSTACAIYNVKLYFEKMKSNFSSSELF
jgi:hypothetical protein